MDPDSRRWHWFRIPMTLLKKGAAELVLENLVFGENAEFIPPERDIWAGWARLTISSHVKELGDDDLSAYDTDEDFGSFGLEFNERE